MFDKKYDVITIGSATRDVFLEPHGSEIRQHTDSPSGTEQCFPLGSKIEIKDFVVTTGGGGTNTAVTFARQGLKTACMFVIGSDQIGEDIIKELEHEHVSTMFQMHSAKSAYSVIVVHDNGERTIFSYKGEGQNFEIKEFPFNKLHAQWLYLASLGGHLDLIEGVVQHAKANKVKLAMNPGGKELELGLEKLKPILENLDVLIINKEEAALLTGFAITDTIENIMQKLRAFCPGIKVLTDGHNGVLVQDSDGKTYFAGVPDSPIVERTGAGDAFGSGFVSEFMRSGDVGKAIQLATANASSVVTQFGAKAGILRQGDLGPWPLVEVKVR